jgi:hypothetical protein
MQNGIGRVLIEELYVEEFVEAVLDIHNTDEKVLAINQIIEAESSLRTAQDASTLHVKNCRDIRYREDHIREQLRDKIVDELSTLNRLDNDDLIALGEGGACPLCDIKMERKFFYVVGSSASGKSTISNTIANLFGAIILDSDYAKRKLPEYKHQVSGATKVHEESVDLIFSRQNGNLLKYCLDNGYNMVVPKVGEDLEGICNFAIRMRSLNYTPYLISVDLDRIKATRRAFQRYKETKRYIPLWLVFDVYSNQPSLNYFKIKQRRNNLFDGYAQISTDVARESKPILIEQRGLEELEQVYGGEQNG